MSHFVPLPSTSRTLLLADAFSVQLLPTVNTCTAGSWPGMDNGNVHAMDTGLPARSIAGTIIKTQLLLGEWAPKGKLS